MDMDNKDNFEHEIFAKIHIERHKIFCDKKNQCADRLKYIAWLTTTLMAINLLSITTSKAAGAISMSFAWITIVSIANICLLSYSLVKVIVAMNLSCIDRNRLAALLSCEGHPVDTWEKFGKELCDSVFFEAICIDSMQKRADHALVIAGIAVGSTFGSPFIEAVCNLFIK